MKTITFDFGVDDGKEDKNGKVFHPNFLHVHINDKNKALEIAESLIRQVRLDRQNEFDVTITLFGKLVESDE
jgi:hypothetical protein